MSEPVEYQPSFLERLTASPAPLLLGALGPVGAVAGLGAFLFGANRIRNRSRQYAANRAAEINRFDAGNPQGPRLDLATATPQQILSEIQQLHEIGAPRDRIQTLENQLTRIGATAGDVRAAEAQDFDQALRLEAEQRQQQQAAAQQAQQRNVQVDRLADNVQPYMTELGQQQRALGVVMNAPETFAGDQAMMTSFARALSGAGVLSDQDIQRVSGGPAVWAIIERARDKLANNRDLSTTERGIIRQAMAGLVRETVATTEMMIAPTLVTAARLGVDPAEVFNMDLLTVPDEMPAPMAAPVGVGVLTPEVQEILANGGLPEGFTEVPQ